MKTEKMSNEKTVTDQNDLIKTFTGCDDDDDDDNNNNNKNNNNSHPG